MNYYYYIAGFPDLQPDDTKNVPALDALKADLEEQLCDNDRTLLHLVYAEYDNRNLLRYLHDKGAELDPLGTLTADDWREVLDLMEEQEHPHDPRLLPYVRTFYAAYRDENSPLDGASHEDYLAGLYYDYAMQCGNRFLREWFEFNLNLRNLLTATACRRHGFDTQHLVVGGNEVARALRKSNARDFGLAGQFDELETVLHIADEPNLLTREQQLDALKWQWLDEHTFFNYFSVERILALVLKCQLLNRWKPLTQERGTAVFRDLLEALKKDVKIEQHP